MSAQPQVRTDGRNARRDRNSEAVLDAVNALFAEGVLYPSVEDVAARSGISLRSVYRYFEDADELIRAAIARRVTLLAALFELPQVGVGPLPDRVERFVDHRMTLYERLAPAVRAALLRAPRAPLIAGQVARRRRELLGQTKRHFAPELKQLGSTQGSYAVDAVDALCQFESLEHLRVRRALSKAKTRATLVEAVTSLLTRV